MRITIDISDESGSATVATSPSPGTTPASTAAPAMTAAAIDAGPAPVDALAGAGSTTVLSASNPLPASSDGLSAGPAPRLS